MNGFRYISCSYHLQRTDETHCTHSTDSPSRLVLNYLNITIRDLLPILDYAKLYNELDPDTNP